jgi:hypothetical protein
MSGPAAGIVSMPRGGAPGNCRPHFVPAIQTRQCGTQAMVLAKQDSR